MPPPFQEDEEDDEEGKEELFLEETLRAAKRCAFLAGKEIRNAWGTTSSEVKNTKKNDVEQITTMNRMKGHLQGPSSTRCRSKS